jgi:hypothetical protein
MKLGSARLSRFEWLRAQHADLLDLLTRPELQGYQQHPDVLGQETSGLYKKAHIHAIESMHSSFERKTRISQLLLKNQFHENDV